VKKYSVWQVNKAWVKSVCYVTE